ncbi:hypothetical protein BGZ76_007469 [Entomortierella beljakovae]|nr:hypothetical protein BGZ76_007469 [Entomortierella beljakovae]
MAPIPRLAAGPLSIITGTIISAFSPNSAPPTDGTNATVWGTEYRGTASFMSLSPDTTPTSPNPSNFYYNNKTESFTGCDNKTFSPTDNVVFINPLQFGDISSTNSTCGEWVQIKNRENTLENAYAQIVGICEDCEYGSLSTNLATLMALSADSQFDQMVFDNNSTVTMANLTDPVDPLPIDTPVSPKNLINIAWQLSEPPKEPLPISSSASPTTTKAPKPTKTVKPKPTTTTTTTTTTTKSKTSAPKPTSPPSGGGGKTYSGRGTWYSDTTGQCEKSYSQSDYIVAVNQAQMGTDKKLCGKKLLVTAKGSSASVVVTVVDMCPSKYCDFGDLDLSQGAFKKFASLGKGVLELSWSFL